MGHRLAWILVILGLISLGIHCDMAKSQPNPKNFIPSIRPFDDVTYPVSISGRFNEARGKVQGGNGYTHQGVDYRLNRGTLLIATAAGRVQYAEDSECGYGNWVVIDHGNGLKTIYGHLSRFEVSEGMEVQRGQVIGRVGKSGWATGYHVHYEVRKDNKPINPWFFIKKT